MLYRHRRICATCGNWQSSYMFDLGLIIGGGTAQIQKNIISERGLGMPREPKLGEGRKMEFGLTSDQKMMQESIDRTLERVCPLERVRKGERRRAGRAAMC